MGLARSVPAGWQKRVPPVIRRPRSGCVYDHGVITIGRKGFAEALTPGGGENWCPLRVFPAVWRLKGKTG